MERHVPHYGAGPFKEPFRIMKRRASEEEEIHPARVEND